jgi:hypothetical protein
MGPLNCLGARERHFESITNDYFRHGTETQLAALDIAIDQKRT